MFFIWRRCGHSQTTALLFYLSNPQLLFVSKWTFRFFLVFDCLSLFWVHLPPILNPNTFFLTHPSLFLLVLLSLYLSYHQPFNAKLSFQALILVFLPWIYPCNPRDLFDAQIFMFQALFWWYLAIFLIQSVHLTVSLFLAFSIPCLNDVSFQDLSIFSF